MAMILVTSLFQNVKKLLDIISGLTNYFCPFPLLAMNLLYGIIIALCFTFYLLETCLIASIYIRKRRGLECFTCVYQLDMHLAIFMEVW